MPKFCLSRFPANLQRGFLAISGVPGGKRHPCEVCLVVLYTGTPLVLRICHHLTRSHLFSLFSGEVIHGCHLLLCSRPPRPRALPPAAPLAPPPRGLLPWPAGAPHPPTAGPRAPASRSCTCEQSGPPPHGALLGTSPWAAPP
jgi:hypothetical protein